MPSPNSIFSNYSIDYILRGDIYRVQWCSRPASPSPFSERSKILYSVHASNLAWSPPTVHSNRSERPWLHTRTFLVAPENRVSWPGESYWIRTLPLFPLTTPANTTLPLQRGRWNLAISYGWEPHDIWQRSRRCGGARSQVRREQSSCSQAYGFATITSEIGCVPNLKFWSAR